MWMTIIIFIVALSFNCISATASDVKDMMDTINPEAAYCEFSAMDEVEGNILIISRQIKSLDNMHRSLYFLLTFCFYISYSVS